MCIPNDEAVNNVARSNVDTALVDMHKMLYMQ